MSLRNLLRGFGTQEAVSLTYRLDGTEKCNYGEIDQVMDRLEAIGAAFSLFPIKDFSPAETPNQKWMHELTDGMTAEQVQEAFDGVVNLMNLLKEGSEAPYNTEGTLKISKHGVLLTWSDTNIGFPFQGVSQKMSNDWTQQRIAEKAGDDVHLRLVVDGHPEVASVSTWIISRSAGRISFSLKEARYWQVKDYGRVLLNQMIEATGKLQ
jgi:hypothetical protein